MTDLELAISELEKRVDALEATQEKHVPVLDEHGERLDGHDVEIGSIRQAHGNLQADFGRLFNRILSNEPRERRIDSGVKELLSLIRPAPKVP